MKEGRLVLLQPDSRTLEIELARIVELKSPRSARAVAIGVAGGVLAGFMSVIALAYLLFAGS